MVSVGSHGLFVIRLFSFESESEGHSGRNDESKGF